MEENQAAQEEQQEIAVDHVEQQEQPKEEPKASIHWEKARETMQMQKMRIEELEQKINSLHQQAPKPIEKDEFEELDPEDYLTVGKAKELAKKLASREAEQTAKKAIQEYAQEQNLRNDEQRMRSKYEDYDYLIENYLPQLIKKEPALASVIQTAKNPAEMAYKLVKLSEDYEEQAMAKPTSAKAEKVLKNAARPTSATAISPSLKSQAEDFSKMSPSQIWEMSQQYARKA